MVTSSGPIRCGLVILIKQSSKIIYVKCAITKQVYVLSSYYMNRILYRDIPKYDHSNIKL